MENTLHEVLKRPIAYHAVIAKAFGSVNLAVLWCQLYYWSERTKDPDGWVYKTRSEIFDETALERRQQETARRIGRELGVVEEKLAGRPAKMHYRVNLEKTIEIVDRYVKELGEPKRRAAQESEVVRDPGEGAVLNGIIALFEPVNPSFEMIFRNTTERAALSRLVKKYGVEKVSSIVRALETIVTQFAAPRITTPAQLERKLGELAIFMKQQGSKQKGRAVMTFES